nr:MAG TPA: hypothetical protein [Caudoviricetes sp.]
MTYIKAISNSFMINSSYSIRIYIKHLIHRRRTFLGILIKRS